MPSYVVTGASRGIGLEFVRQLSASPENIVFALVRNKSTALTVPSSPLKNPVENVHILEADVTDHKALKNAAERVAELTGGGLDVLINNAAALHGENDRKTLFDFEGEDELLEEVFDRAIKVNVVGVIYSTNSFLPLLRKGETKKVVTIGSEVGDRDFVMQTGMAPGVAYAASKAAVNIIVAKYATMLQTEGIIVVALSPGLVDTSATMAVLPTNSEWRSKMAENLTKLRPDLPGMRTPAVSVQKQLEIIADCSIQDTGSFLSEWKY